MKDSRVVATGADTYHSYDDKRRYQLVDGQWHRFDLTYNVASCCDGPGNGFGSLAEVVRFDTGEEPVITGKFGEPLCNYDNDLRVAPRDCGCCYDVVQPNGVIGKAAPGMLGGFVCCSDGVESDGPGFNTMDEAIWSLIGP